MNRYGFVCAMVLLAAANAATIVVNPAVKTADDANPGSEARPLRSIAKAAEMARAGDTVLIYVGVYRESVIVKQSGTAEKPIRFEAAPGAVVVVTGADRITEWRREADGAFSADWPHRVSRPHPNDEFHALIGHSEQVFVNGYALRMVGSKDKLTRGTFWIDAEAKRLWTQALDGRDLSNKRATVEASVRPLLWQVDGAYVHTRGIRFRYASNPAQRGAAVFAGRGDVVEDCVFERTNASGAAFRGEDITVRRCEFAENGQLGFSANKAHRLLITECTVRGNNTKGFNRDWEAGGNKLVLSRGVVIERSVFKENRGHGIWFDIGNEANTVRHCRIANNEDGGIFYEISYGLHAHDNVIVGNGHAETPGAWGAQAGINLSSSPDCVIERNLLLGNREGFAFREQSRKTNRIGGERDQPVWNHNQVIRKNVIAWNTSSQVAGWFDTKEARHWPGAGLEELKLTFAENVFARYAGQGLVQWGPRWTRHKDYATLADWRAELNIDRNSVETALPFSDPTTLDFRLPTGHAALKLDAMPRGPVPGVRLGARP